MRVGLSVREKNLGGALGELLLAAGHEVVHQEAAWPTCALMIYPEHNGDRPPTGVPLLYLRPAAFEKADARPGPSLRAAFREVGTAVWCSPLDAGLLLRVLAETEGVTLTRRPPSTCAPTLTTAPYPWLRVDIDRGRITGWNVAGRELLALPDRVPGPGVPLEEILLPDALRTSVRHTSSARRPAISSQRTRARSGGSGLTNARGLSSLGASQRRSPRGRRSRARCRGCGGCVATKRCPAARGP